MSSYLPPTNNFSIFNASEFISLSDNLTIAAANSLYARLTGNNTLIGQNTFSFASTALSGSTNYNFLTINQPSTTGSTLGNCATLYIAGAPSGGFQNDALNINSGDLRLTNGIIHFGVSLAESTITGNFQSITMNAPTSHLLKIAGSTKLTVNSTGTTVTGKTTTTSLQCGSNGSTINQIQTGLTSALSAIAPNGQAVVNVTFSSSFSSTPNVNVGICATTGGNLDFLICQAFSVTTTGFSISIRNLSSTNTSSASGIFVSWIATN